MIRLLAVVLLMACGGARSTKTGQQRPPRGDTAGATTTGTTGIGTGTGSGSAVTQATDTRPTDAECDALLLHIIELDIKARPPDHDLGDQQRRDIAGRLRGEFVPGCRAMQRGTYDCAVAATTTAMLRACDAAPST